jgi:hypothetical protein
MSKLIPLTQGKYAIVDDEDYDRVMQYKWVTQKVYKEGKIRATGWIADKGFRMKLARFVLLPFYGASLSGKEIDHIDGDPLNNQRSNLRVCTRPQNQWNRGKQKNNTSGFKGVHWSKRAQKWHAGICYRGRKKSLGNFDDPVLAAKAYDKAARQFHGAFARLNFPDQEGK